MDPIQVGQVLDKYELLERVGQGGMAIVYRGRDRELKREVAVKILHRHLADYQEARDRFEREAQAVAKLRHENILEIFDYSGARAAEAYGASYIVTEFIEGQTLKQFITDRPIEFPEIGAMIVLQVCRALAHAHGANILHRDVKPENIMIRSDGVVKLMDFGISHMVDLERLTVTGQLLGSPAYMAPEHVEGRPIDFRTDVFAAGIVLYQLTVGKLPFEGRNPHEVLKRIADCKFVDPRQANPRIGNRLGRIILRAMAASPDARYAAIGEMVVALERYLDESGLGPAPSELARYFKTPAAYEAALRERLVDHLTRRGQQLMREDHAAALDALDRVLTMDPKNARVLAILDSLDRRRKLKVFGLAVLGVVAVGGGALAIHHATRGPAAAPIDSPDAHGSPVAFHRPTVKVQHETPPPVGSGSGAAIVGEPTDAGVAGVAGVAVIAPSDAHRVVAPGPADAALVAPASVVELTVSPRSSEVQLAGGAWQPTTNGRIAIPVDHDVDVHVRNLECCQEDAVTLHPGQAPQTVSLLLLPGRVVPTCADPTVTARVDGKNAELGQAALIPFGDASLTTHVISVEFFGKDGEPRGKRNVKVTANKETQVPCDGS
jgi:serine/threonine-protein kinase